MATNKPSISDQQALLSEQLQLLSQLDCVDINAAYVDPTSCMEVIHKECKNDATLKRDLGILNAIARVLTREPGEVFAAAFDKRQGVIVVLAKNNPVTPEDEQAIKDLITMITTENHACDGIPFLFSRCWENIQKRITKMLGSLSEFSNDLNQVLQHYEPLSIDDELPKSVDYRKGRYSGAVEPPKHDKIMKDLVNDIQDWAQQCNPRDIKSSTVVFCQLAMATELLRRSRLLRLLIEGRLACSSTTQQQAEKLKRRLNKVCQYYFDIDHLISTKETLGHGVKWCWVDTVTGTGETALKLVDDPLHAKSFSGDTIPITQDDIETLRGKFSNMKKSWPESRSLQIHVHPEIRIVLALSDEALTAPKPIGCSQRSCLCCTLWIEKHNFYLSTQWYTSDSHDKPRADWALPSVNPTKKMGDTLNDTVLRTVSRCLTSTLRSLLKKRTSYDEELEASEKKRHEFFTKSAVLSAPLREQGHGV